MSNVSSSSSSGKRHHHGQPGDDFAYQTRMVVYNFMGLVPSTPGREDDEDDWVSGGGEAADIYCVEQGDEGGRKGEGEENRGMGSWTDDLSTLPTVSLIDRLNESVALQEMSAAVGREIKVDRSLYIIADNQVQPIPCLTL